MPCRCREAGMVKLGREQETCIFTSFAAKFHISNVLAEDTVMMACS